MGIQVIYLDEDDDLASIEDRLNWVGESKVIFVLPDKGDFLTEYLDLAFLRRQSDERRIDVGLVTLDSRVAKQARALGFPTFKTVRKASNKRQWRRGRRRNEWVGYPSWMDEGDKKEVQKRKAPKPIWRKWLNRYLTILLFLFTVALLFVAAVYAIPGATVKFRPIVNNLTVSKSVIADPNLEEDNFEENTIPGRLLVTEADWIAEVETTGLIEIPDAPANGTVILVNKLNQPLTVPAGTRVSTSGSARQVFQTVDSVDLPAFVGATAETNIVAIEPGVSGNVEANQINRIEGALSLQADVRNLEATDGGSTRLESSVTDADRERLRAQVLDQVQKLALIDMKNSLAEGERLAEQSLHETDIIHETYSHFSGERTDRLTLELRAVLAATAFQENQATGIVYEELVAAVDPGFNLIPETLQFTSGEIFSVDGEGRVTFEMLGEGKVAAILYVDDWIQPVLGQKLHLATAYLYERLPLSERPDIQIWPSWFPRLPYLPARVQTQIVTN